MELTLKFFRGGLHSVEGLPEGAQADEYRLNVSFGNPDNYRNQFERTSPSQDFPVMVLYDGSRELGRRVVAFKTLADTPVTLNEIDVSDDPDIGEVYSQPPT